MECPQCGLTNPPGTSVCTVCSTPLPLSEQTLPLTATPLSSSDVIESDRTMEAMSVRSDVRGPYHPLAAPSRKLNPLRTPG
jgi:hypothetical protein